MKKIKNLFVFFLLVLLVSCGGNGGGSKKVDVNTQQKPTIIVMPSDQLLKKFGALQNMESLGKTIIVRDFNKYMLSDVDSKFVISAIQNAFVEYGYPLNDLEQTLKSINDQDIVDEVDGIKKDAKTILLTNAKPDIILEFDYNVNIDRSTRDYKKSLTYTLRAIDSFSNKVVAASQKTGFNDGSENTITSLMNAALQLDKKGFTSQIDGYFKDIVENGRDITVRITIDRDANLDMSDECLDGDTYTDFIIDYMKVNALLGSYKMTRSTDSELYFSNVRIKTLNDNGTQYSAYDFARELSKAINKGCGIKSKNVTQGLGDATIIMKGM